MPRPRLPDPKKKCQQCNTLMQRKRFASGTLEDRTAFLKRKYCDQVCMAKAMTGVIKNPNPRNSRRQSAKQARSKCQNCGTTSNLHVHHKNLDPMDNRKSNFQTLCGRCHKRLHWQITNATKPPAPPCKNCNKPARHNGLCNTHWTRFRKSGDPLLRRERQNGKWVWVRDDG